MVDNAENFFKHTDEDGDSVEFIATADQRLTLTAKHEGQQPIYCYLDPAAVDRMIDGLQRWRGRRTVTSEFWCGYGHDHGRHLHTAHRVLSECLGVRGDIYCAESAPAPAQDGPECLICTHPVTHHRPDNGCRYYHCPCGNVEELPTPNEDHRFSALRLAAELWSSRTAPVGTWSPGDVLDTADEFAHWLATGERDLSAEPVTVTPGLRIPLQASPDPECPICRHEAHGATHCGVKTRRTSLVVERCACMGVLTA